MVKKEEKNNKGENYKPKSSSNKKTPRESNTTKGLSRKNVDRKAGSGTKSLRSSEEDSKPFRSSGKGPKSFRPSEKDSKPFRSPEKESKPFRSSEKEKPFRPKTEKFSNPPEKDRSKSENKGKSFSPGKKPFIKENKEFSGNRKNNFSSKSFNSSKDKDKKPFEKKENFSDRKFKEKEKGNWKGRNTKESTERERKPFIKTDRSLPERDVNSSKDKDKKPFEKKENLSDKKFKEKGNWKERNTKESSERKPFKTKERSFPEKDVKTPAYNLNKPPKKTFSKSKPKEEDKSETKDLIRLNRYIASSGICSRRDADQLIQEGLVKVNGKVITELGHKVSLNDKVEYKNRVLAKEKPVYVLLNKPKDFITTMEDPEERKTVMDLVKNACKERVFPVGRLDRNTTGLLLLTNDGELAEKLTHPSNKISKVYEVGLDKPIIEADFVSVITGIELEDGNVKADDLAILTPDKKNLGIEIHEGRNRIVRRIFEHLGYEVIKLDRVSYAGLTKKDLPRGKWRYLSEKEVVRLKFFIK